MNPVRKLVGWFKLGRAMLRLTRDPSKLDEVFGIIDVLTEGHRHVLERVVDEEKRHEQGRSAFLERPRLGQVSLERLRSMPEGSLGAAFAAFLDRYALDPSALPSLDATDDVSYLNAHLYESHDLWHVVTGFETDVAGELGLQAFYAAQISSNLPEVILAVGFLNTFLFAFHDRRRRLAAIAQGWSLGRATKPLLGYRWDQALERPLVVVQRELGLPEARLSSMGLAT